MSSTSETGGEGDRNQAPQGRAIDLSSLPLQQLDQVKTQLNGELQHLTNSYSQLKTAQVKFRDCGNSIRDGVQPGPGTPILVPLTSSLYVPGKLASTETVLVDVGTGFYVEKSPDAAQEFYTRKVEELARNLVDLEKIVQGKQENLMVVENVLRQKAMQSRKEPNQADAADG